MEADGNTGSIWRLGSATDVADANFAVDDWNFIEYPTDANDNTG